MFPKPSPFLSQKHFHNCVFFLHTYTCTHIVSKSQKNNKEIRIFQLHKLPADAKKIASDFYTNLVPILGNKQKLTPELQWTCQMEYATDQTGKQKPSAKQTGKVIKMTLIQTILIAFRIYFFFKRHCW